MKNSGWFKMQAADDGKAVIEIYDVIGSWDINAQIFRNQLKMLGDVAEIELRINSPGGDVIDGFAIYNMLLEHPANVTAVIDGWAASMGSIIAMAADEIAMPSNTWMMIHNPWTQAMGEADDLRRMADVLDKMEAHAIKAYQRHTEMSAEAIAELMAAETWMDGSDAFEMGFATVLLDEMKIAASVCKPGSMTAPDAAMAWVKGKDEPEQEEAPGMDTVTTIAEIELTEDEITGDAPQNVDAPEDDEATQDPEEKPEAEEEQKEDEPDTPEEPEAAGEDEAPAEDSDESEEEPEVKEDDPGNDNPGDAPESEDSDDEPEGLSEDDVVYDEGYAAGYAKAQGAIADEINKAYDKMKAEISEAKAEAVKLREQIKEKAENIEALEKVRDEQTEMIEQYEQRLQKFSAGLKAIKQGEQQGMTFEGAVNKYGYQEARRKFPELYEASRDYHRNNRREK